MASSELRTFRAPTMAQALAEVKKALGGDAVILHTRSHKVGGVMGVGAKQLVEITASAPKGARSSRISLSLPGLWVATTTQPENRADMGSPGLCDRECLSRR